MYKSYTIKACKFKEISEGRGTISYLLVDEKGERRTVIAKAKCGFIKQIKLVEAIHHRETPLVEALANASINDTISIDFSDFNRKYPRVHAKSQTERLARGTMKNGHTISKMDLFNVNAYRILQLFGIAGAVLLVVMVSI